MASVEWDKTVKPVEQKTWVRSYNQNFETLLGTDFKLTAYLQRVTTAEDGTTSLLVKSEEVSPVSLLASEAAVDPEIGPLALVIQENMTAIIGILYARSVANGGS
jgi:hypothetical protein